MPIRSICFYTYRTSGGGWTAPQLGVLRFVRAIKNEPVRTSEYVLVNGTEPKRLLQQKNASDAFDWYAEMAIRWIKKELGTLRVVLVPIPNSDCTQNVKSSRTRALADAIVKKAVTTTVADVLRWNEKMVPAHKGGDRDPALLYPHLRVVPTGWTPPNRPHVLIDDVATSGGHLRASGAILNVKGASVALALAGAQAEQMFTGDPFKERIADYDDYKPPKA